MDFIYIPKALFTHTRLSVPAMVLYGYLQTEANNGSVITSSKAMREVLHNCSNSTLTRALAELINLNLIAWKGYTPTRQRVYTVEAV